MNTHHPKSCGLHRLHRLSRSTTAVLALLGAAGAGATEIETSNPDLAIRFDNTVRLNYAVRAQERNSLIGNDAIADEGDYSFNRGAAVAERIDWLSEFDIVYKKRYGARVSATGWRDFAYGGTEHSNPNPPLSAIPSYPGNVYSPYIERYYRGGSGQFLDAFVFGGTDIGDVPVDAKLGRHTVYWGESLLLSGNLNSVAYSQNPLDLQKAYATPGIEAKELFLPLNQLSMQAQLSDTLSVAGQYMLEWESFRYPEGGTYLGPVDFAFNGPERQYVSAGLGFAANGPAIEPKQHGEWGLSTRWSPEWLDGTMGFYVRDFADKMPQTFITKVAANASQYDLIYANDIMLYGVSLAKNIGGISVSGEFSKRINTPLNSAVLGIAPGLPAPGQTSGPRGDTQHALINAVGSLSKAPLMLFDSATWVTELTWSDYTRVRSGANLFNALGYAPCSGKTMWDGCTTHSYVGIGAGFTPSWFQVIPGVDLSAPLTYSVGLRGNAATVFGGNQRAGNYSVGLGFDVLQKYRFDLKYNDFLGAYKTNAAGTAVSSQNGFNALLTDRGFISLTFKTTF